MATRRRRSTYRAVRQTSYNVARHLGNWQPLWDFLSDGDLSRLLNNTLRRTLRRIVGKAFSRYEYGAQGNILLSFALFYLGRKIGARGRR